MSVARCKRRYCGTVLTERHDRHLGRVELVCVPCERNAAGRCRDCPAALPSARAQRCAACSARKNAERDRDRKRRVYADPVLRDRQLTRRRELNSRPEVRAKRAAEQRARRAAQPKPVLTDGDRLYKRVWQNAKYKTDPAFRQAVKDRARERHRRRRARDLAAKLATGLYTTVPIRGAKNGSRYQSVRLVRIHDQPAAIA